LEIHIQRDRLRNWSYFLCDRSEGDQPPLAVVGYRNCASTIWPAMNKHIMIIYVFPRIVKKKYDIDNIIYNTIGVRCIPCLRRISTRSQTCWGRSDLHNAVHSVANLSGLGCLSDLLGLEWYLKYLGPSSRRRYGRYQTGNKVLLAFSQPKQLLLRLNNPIKYQKNNIVQQWSISTIFKLYKRLIWLNI